jgi:hypothetical protein
MLASSPLWVNSNADIPADSPIPQPPREEADALDA